MYSRLLKPPEGKSFFLFGPRGSGKTTWAHEAYPKAIYIDLLESEIFNDLLANPQRLETLIPGGFQDWVVIDEIQKVPSLLDEVHRLIEKRRLRFVLTGSSPRKLRRQGVNLLGGRALTHALHPLTAVEMGSDFRLDAALKHGLIPGILGGPDPRKSLESYVRTYLEEEVRQEGLTRNLAAFARFLEAASFSQAGLLNVVSVSRECAVERKVAESYFGILEDLLLAHRLPVFERKAKRRLTSHPKFFFFDVGVFRTLRPSGPLDVPEEAEGPAYETLLLQNMLAINDALALGYKFHYWRTPTQAEVDFVLYGERGLLAIEVKRGSRVASDSVSGLKLFLKDYPMAKAILVYGGNRRLQLGSIEVWPMETLLRELPAVLAGGGN